MGVSESKVIAVLVTCSAQQADIHTALCLQSTPLPPHQVPQGGITPLASTPLPPQQVPQGSVTPLAVANPSAAGVCLLLDLKILAAERVYVHPLVNTASLGMSPAALTAGLRC